MMPETRPAGRAGWLLWVALGAALGFGLLAVWLGVAATGRAAVGPAPAAPLVTVIPFPTGTPVPSATPTPPPETSIPATSNAPDASPDVLHTGMLVAVSGTEGDGLRLRALPGVDADVNLIGLESEVFEIREGPVEAAGRTWWYLVNPYDSTKFGWGASEYLVPADSQ
jgi:hypothetical protein